MAWKTILPGREVPDAKEDAKRAAACGAGRLSEKAVYLPGREYLSLDAVLQARLYASRMNTHGCCGLGLPVWYVLLYYGAEAPLKLLFEKREEAQAALDRIAAARSEIQVLPPNDAV